MMPNRRPNRIAGPGFHINVRYDDSHMARAMSSANSAHPKVQMGTNQREVFDVKEQELLVTKKGNTMYHDGYTHCISVANGFPNTAGVTNLEEEIMKQVQFVGVATTEYKPSKAYSEQGFVAQVGGVTTLINEGEDTIRPGDKVCIGINLTTGRMVTRDRGIPREKIRFCIKKAAVGDDMILAAINSSDCKVAPPNKAEVLAAENGLKQAKKTKDKEKIATAQAALTAAKTCLGGTDGIKAVVKKVQQLNERVIGKAASFARKGDRLEVILQPRNPY